MPAYVAGEERSLDLDRQALGEPQPWVVTHRGLEYSGEVIIADAVDPEWGRELPVGTCFRVVLFTVPRRIPPRQLQDPRIAMAVPRRAASESRTRLSHEIQAIHEARERYVTGSDPESRSMIASLEERQESLQGEIAGQEALSYSQGRIYTRGGMTIRPADIFAEPSAQSWIELLVHAVFVEAYPSLPFDHGRFPSALSVDKMGRVLRGLMQDAGEDSELAASFGPALGLSKPDTPGTFDASESPVVDIIQRAVDTGAGEVAAEAVTRTLCADYGLNEAMSTLYLLAWARHTRSEVSLMQDHEVRLRSGGPLVSDRISWDLVPEVSFSVPTAGHLGVLRERPPVEWNTVLPYASQLVEGLGLSDDADEISRQEARLVGALESTGRRLESAVEAMRALTWDTEEWVESTPGALDAIQVLYSASGYRGLYAAAVSGFGGPSGLEEALELHDRIDQLSTLVPEITRIRTYLDRMSFGREHQDLSLSRDAVLARMGLQSLIADPRLWRSVEESFQQLFREHAAAYHAHHARYHEESEELSLRLQEAGPRAEALEQFNRVPELGGPLGVDVPERFSSLTESLRSCTAREDQISLEDSPVCPECQLDIGEEVPRREATRVLRDLESAMREYNRRLSSEGVSRILAHPTREQIDQFVDLVRVSDLSALGNILDEQVLEFLRRFVRRD